MFEQVKLSYANDGLEPYVDTATVETHYGKHHATYTKNFNDAVEKAGLAGKTVEDILGNLDGVADEGLRKALKNNGGGYYNHNLYFSTLSPEPGAPSAKFLQAVEEAFGSLEALTEKLSGLAKGQFGSGWAFLSVTPEGRLVASASANQDNPISEGTGNVPILALDIWEHAYYLKYRNRRPDYIDAFFKVLDWAAVSALYEKAVA